MRVRAVDSGTFAAVAVFAMLLVDGFVLAPFGARLLPVDYETVRILTILSGLAAGGMLYGALRGRRRSVSWLTSTTVPWHIVVVLLLLPVAVASVLGLFGSVSWFLDLFAHFRLQYTGVLLLGVAVLLLLRQPKWALVAGAFLGVNGVLLFPYVVPWPRGDAAGEGPTLRLVTANVNVMNRDYEKLTAFVGDVDADVVVLEEINDDWVEALAVLEESHPHVVSVPRRNNFGIGIWSRFPFRSSEVVAFVHENLPSVLVTVEVSGKELVLVGTHPLPPRDARNTELRNRQLEEAAAAATSGDSWGVVLGDLNTTPWGYGFRNAAGKTGLRDSGLNMGIQWSWPSGFWPLALPLDHCLVSKSVRILDRWVGPDVGSDHYPVVVDVQLVD